MTKEMLFLCDVLEAWCKKTGSKITDKPRRAIEEEEEPKKEPAPAAVYTESGLDCDTSKGKLFEGLEPDINRIVEKYSNDTRHKSKTSYPRTSKMTLNMAELMSWSGV